MGKISVPVSVAALVFVAAFSAAAEDLATIRQALEARYLLTTTTADKTDIVTAGDVLVLRKSNLAAEDVKSKYPNPNKYVNGRISQGAVGKTVNWLKMIPGAPTDVGINERVFVSGEKLWLTGIEVRDLGVTLVLFSDPYSETRYEARLAFPFEKGWTPSANEVMARIAEVFSVQSADDGGGQSRQSPATGGQFATSPNPGALPQAETKVIGLSQTPAQVTAILGQPGQIFNAGAKQIYMYRDLKVTFLNGRVADIE